MIPRKRKESTKGERIEEDPVGSLQCMISGVCSITALLSG